MRIVSGLVTEAPAAPAATQEPNPAAVTGYTGIHKGIIVGDATPPAPAPAKAGIHKGIVVDTVPAVQNTPTITTTTVDVKFAWDDYADLLYDNSVDKTTVHRNPDGTLDVQDTRNVDLQGLLDDYVDQKVWDEGDFDAEGDMEIVSWTVVGVNATTKELTVRATVRYTPA